MERAGTDRERSIISVSPVWLKCFLEQESRLMRKIFFMSLWTDTADYTFSHTHTRAHTHTHLISRGLVRAGGGGRWMGLREKSRAQVILAIISAFRKINKKREWALIYQDGAVRHFSYFDFPSISVICVKVQTSVPSRTSISLPCFAHLYRYNTREHIEC